MKSPREQTRFTEIERACARVFRNVFTRNNNNLKLSKIVSIFPMKIAPRKRTDNLGCTDESLKNFIRESARGNPHTSPAREYQNDVVFIALLDFNPILESFDVLFDVQHDE